MVCFIVFPPQERAAPETLVLLRPGGIATAVARAASAYQDGIARGKQIVCQSIDYL
jgi:hypothetical protein